MIEEKNKKTIDPKTGNIIVPTSVGQQLEEALSKIVELEKNIKEREAKEKKSTEMPSAEDLTEAIAFFTLNKLKKAEYFSSWREAIEKFIDGIELRVKNLPTYMLHPTILVPAVLNGIDAMEAQFTVAAVTHPEKTEKMRKATYAFFRKFVENNKESFPEKTPKPEAVTEDPFKAKLIKLNLLEKTDK
jgi:hypothetical protein